MTIHYLIIGQGEGPFEEFESLNTRQVEVAVDSSLRDKLYIELYVNNPKGQKDPEGTPDIGLVFKEGVYEGHGLGSCEDDPIPFAEDVEKVFKPFIGKLMKGDQVAGLLMGLGL